MTAATKTKPAAAEVVEHTNLAAALAAFQSEMPTVHKGKTAKVSTKAGGSYTYDYADLADVAKVAHPVLARHGLSFAARPTHLDGLGFVLVGVLRHESGETDEGTLPIQGRTAQEIGSSLTYNRRYLLGCMTGVVTDADDDGAMANDAQNSRPKAQQQGRQQQGRTQPEKPAAAPAPDAGQAGRDDSVVKAYTIAATKAEDLAALREAWDNAIAADVVNAFIPDPYDQTGDAPRVTLGDFITRRKTEIEGQAAA